MAIKMVGELIKVDVDKRAYLCEKKWIVLPKREFRLLYALAGNRGQLVSAERLVALVWHGEESPEFEVPAKLRMLVERLRARIGPGRIESVKMHGYRFKADA